MSAELPETLDAWRAITARNGFSGHCALSALPRLAELLFDTDGDVSFSLEFDRDDLKVPYVALRIEANLPLQCQRTLERFVLPVLVEQRLGVLKADADEADEAALPEGYEPLLVDAEGNVHPLAVVEDELILAVPVVPLKPGSEAVERDWPVSAEEEQRANPFAALAGLKKTN